MRVCACVGVGVCVWVCGSAALRSSRFQRGVLKQLLDEIHMSQDHAATAVPLEAEAVQCLPARRGRSAGRVQQRESQRLHGSTADEGMVAP